MNPEKTIQLTRKGKNGDPELVDVKLRYCAATETGFEAMSGKSMEVFNPKIVKDDKGTNQVINPIATDEDYIKLAMSAIIAAYARNEEEPPVQSEDIIYECTRQQVMDMVMAVSEMRIQWLNIPKLIESEIKKEAETKKTSRKKKNV
jgi:hypothetical protein